MNREITVRVRLDEKTFRRFCRFDAFRLRKKWVRPLAFALILSAFAALALLTRKAQAGMIAAVLLAVGIGLPLVYIGTFLSQVNMQVMRHGLKPPKPVYTVRMDRKGVHVTNDQKEEAPIAIAWADARAAFRVKGCVYLYVNAARAFLLPDGQADAEPDVVWTFIKDHMGDKAKALRP